MTKIAVKEAREKLQIIETNEKYRTDACQKYTGEGHRVEYVRMNKEGTLCMAVNEDGLPLQLETNFFMKFDNPLYPVQRIVGTACFVRHKYVNVFEEEIWDYEIEDLTDEDLEFINKFFDKTYQMDTEWLFHFLGGY